MNIAVILGSTRQGRSGERVARFVHRRLSLQSDVKAELLDLRDYPLPYYEEAEIPSEVSGDYASEVANRWRDKVAAQDGFIIVTPEYNHGYSAVLKNALDYLYLPWVDKPVSFVSYSSGPVGGARVVEQLRQVVSNLKLIDLSGALHLGRVKDILDEEGNVLNGPFEQLLDKQIGETIEWTRLLKRKREIAKN